MSDKSNWQNEVQSPQRGSVTANVQTNRHGPESTPTAGQLTDDRPEQHKDHDF